MQSGDDYVEHLLDLLAPIGVCRPRRMFGGWGIFLGTSMVGLVWERRFYLKVDEETRQRFIDVGGEPFVYEARGRAMPTSYMTPPDDAFDSPSAMSPWAKLAAAAAQRRAEAKPAKPTKKPAPKKANPAKTKKAKPAKKKKARSPSKTKRARGSK